jgi:segregation and condensation protein B
VTESVRATSHPAADPAPPRNPVMDGVRSTVDHVDHVDPADVREPDDSVEPFRSRELDGSGESGERASHQPSDSAIKGQVDIEQPGADAAAVDDRDDKDHARTGPDGVEVRELNREPILAGSDDLAGGDDLAGQADDEPAETAVDSGVQPNITPTADITDINDRGPGGDAGDAGLAEHDPDFEVGEGEPPLAEAASPVGGLDYADPTQLEAALEAILFIVESPVSAEQLASVLQRPTPEVEEALDRLRSRYDVAGSGIELRRIADGFRIYTRVELTGVVEAFLLEGQRTKLSNAALETLAVIAYRQPVTRGRISAIRGVNVDGVIRTLVTRGLIVEDGTEPESGAGLFATTALFLEKMGLRTLEELPSLAPLLPEIDSLETDELSR